MFSALPKYINFHILTNLTWLDLKNCTLVSHRWQDLVASDEFWQYKLRLDYGLINNTINVSWRTWYYRVANSGPLYSEKAGKTSVIWPDNIYIITPSCKGYYYLDLFGQLYYDNDYIPDLSHQWFGSRLYNDRPEYPEKIMTSTGLEQIIIRSEDGTLAPVRQTIPTNYGNFILTNNSELYVYTRTGRQLLATDVKMIYGNKHHLLYQTQKLDLYYLEMTKTLNAKFLQSNVALVRRIENNYELECYSFTTRWHKVTISRDLIGTSSLIYEIEDVDHVYGQHDLKLRRVVGAQRTIYIGYRLTTQDMRLMSSVD